MRRRADSDGRGGYAGALADLHDLRGSDATYRARVEAINDGDVVAAQR